MNELPRILAVLCWAFAALAWLSTGENKHLEAAAVCGAASWLSWLSTSKKS